jgi:hypothetical protein
MSTSIEMLLVQSPEYHVWVAEYSITHDRMMRLGFHHGDLPRRAEVDTIGCSYFRGRLEGGPYRLAIEQRPRDSFGGKRSPHEYRLYDLGGELEIICDELIVGRVW